MYYVFSLFQICFVCVCVCAFYGELIEVIFWAFRNAENYPVKGQIMSRSGQRNCRNDSCFGRIYIFCIIKGLLFIPISIENGCVWICMMAAVCLAPAQFVTLC